MYLTPKSHTLLSKPVAPALSQKTHSQTLLLNGNSKGVLTRVLAEADDYGRPRTCSFSHDGSEQIGKKRRSIRRKKYYGSVELLVSVDALGRIKDIGRFRLEPGPETDDQDYGVPSSPLILENPQAETRWYFRYFLGKDHHNFAGIDPHTKSPFFFSVLLEEEADGCIRCRTIQWVKSGPKKLCFPCQQPPNNKAITAKIVLQKVPGLADNSRGLKDISNPKLQKDLTILEDQEGSISFKFGVIYRVHGQTTDNEMLSNETGNAEFDQFLQLLGQRIDLHNWGNFKGGLDTTTNTTGTTSVYTSFAGLEIMFHVSTMLPYSTQNAQQVERKRHTGNDIVNIIFEVEGDPTQPSFNPSMMKSQFTHIFALVTYERETNCYRLWTFSEESVPEYGPVVPNPPEFYEPSEFREFLLTKCINGEKAAFGAHAFTEKRIKTNDTLINDMYMEYIKDCTKGFKMSDYISKPLRCVKSTEAWTNYDQPQVEFVKFGELIKLEKMLSGESSDSYPINPTTILRKQPWEPHLLYSDLPKWDVVSSDACGNRSMFLATGGAGVLFLSAGLATPVVDDSAKVQQLSVVETFGLLIARCDKGKEGFLTAFTLSQLRGCLNTKQTLQKKDCLVSKLPQTKGCHLYGATDSNNLRLTLVACTGRRLVLLRWALGPLGRTQPGTGLSKNFTLLHELNVTEEPLLISVLETNPQSQVRACIATKHGIEMIDFSKSLVNILYKSDSSHGIPKGLMANADVDNLEVVVTYDSTTVVFDPDRDDDPLEITWTSNPIAIAYCYPVLLAFAVDTMEVRLGVNGNLLATNYMPGVQLLAAKDDVFFAAEQTTASVSGSASKLNVTEKRWSVYRIKTHDETKDPLRAKKPSSGARTPHPHRPVHHPLSMPKPHELTKGGPMSAGEDVHKSSSECKKWPQNMAKEAEAARKSLGSDSGVGTQDRSSISSTELCSMPPSPMQIDPFIDATV